MRSREELDALASQIVDGLVKVHRAMGPGLFESTYQTCLAHELRSRGLKEQCEVSLPVRYAGIEIEAGYRIDMLFEDCIVIENKSVQSIAPIHEAQILTYLRLSGNKLGFLVNRNVQLIQEGIKRIANNF